MMQIQVLTPTGKIFEGNCSAVIVPGSGGEFEVLQNHAAIVSSLEPGNVRITLSDGTKKTYSIQSGFIEVLKNEVALLITLAEA
jgi:F-type H+-transporting ATPase subunit epsilon